MKKWFLSLSGAVSITALAILSEMWRGFLDAVFVFPVEFTDPAMGQIAAIIFSLLFGGWALALAFAWRGSRKALIITFALNLLVLFIIPISWLVFYCPVECREDAGIFNLANTINLLLCALAAIALGFQIWKPQSDQEPEPDIKGAYNVV